MASDEATIEIAARFFSNHLTDVEVKPNGNAAGTRESNSDIVRDSRNRGAPARKTPVAL